MHHARAICHVRERQMAPDNGTALGGLLEGHTKRVHHRNICFRKVIAVFVDNDVASWSQCRARRPAAVDLEFAKGAAAASKACGGQGETSTLTMRWAKRQVVSVVPVAKPRVPATGTGRASRVMHHRRRRPRLQDSCWRQIKGVGDGGQTLDCGRCSGVAQRGNFFPGSPLNMLHGQPGRRLRSSGWAIDGKSRRHRTRRYDARGGRQMSRC